MRQFMPHGINPPGKAEQKFQEGSRRRSYAQIDYARAKRGAS
jgi:hypothetical protein